MIHACHESEESNLSIVVSYAMNAITTFLFLFVPRVGWF